MLYPLQTSVLKSEGGGLAEGNTQVGGEPSQKQTTLLSLLNQQHGSCSLNQGKVVMEGRWSISIMSTGSIPTSPQQDLAEASTVP